MAIESAPHATNTPASTMAAMIESDQAIGRASRDPSVCTVSGILRRQAAEKARAVAIVDVPFATINGMSRVVSACLFSTER